MNIKAKIMLEKAENLPWAYDVNEKSSADLLLLDNVQFIYELSLAQLELQSLSVDFQVTNSLREFKINNGNEDVYESIRRRSAYYKMVKGTFTDYFHVIGKNRTRSINQYLTHWIYPYKGKFHPQMIRALLNIIGLKHGDILFEPFSGSGTAPLEAQLLGISCIGIDISPLCVLQGRVKTESVYALSEIVSLKDKVIQLFMPILSNEDTFNKSIEQIENEKVRDFYKMARLLAVSDRARRHRDFNHSFIKNVNLMISSVRDYKNIAGKLNLKLGNVKLSIGDSRNVQLPDNSVDGIITSPPYSIALDYVQNDAHSLADMGYNIDTLRENFIGVREKGKDRIAFYNEDMEKSYAEMYRVLKPGKFAVVVIGNATYQGKEIPTVQFTINTMQNLGFNLVKNISKIIFGLYNVMKEEKILIFKKAH